jgi:hypothetical protein
MPQINVFFEEKEFEELLDIKNGESWHDFIIKGGKLIRVNK